uniref:Uncharacterized protein n=1 Tax=Pelusios castaneus TaxID=367368 RepID=A0A8C8RJQ7_9SAUR
HGGQQTHPPFTLLGAPSVRLGLRAHSGSLAGACGDCYHIGTPLIVGAVAGDLVFTLFLIVGTQELSPLGAAGLEGRCGQGLRVQESWLP